MSYESKILNLIRYLGLIIGLLALFYWIWELTPNVILNTLLNLKLWVFVLMANSLLWYLLYTYAWYLYFGNLETSVSFYHLFKIKICGEAINLSLPLNFLGGDPLRFMLLKNFVGVNTRLGSVLVDRILHSASIVVFVLFGVMMIYFVDLKIPSWVPLTLLITYFLGTLFFVRVFYLMTQGRVFNQFGKLLLFFKVHQKYPQFEEKLKSLQDELSQFSSTRFLTMTYSFLIHLIGRFLGAVEIAFIFYIMTHHFQWAASILLASLTSVIHLVFSFIPGGLGIVESLYGAFFLMAGLSPEDGVLMQLIRRLRSLIWIGIGIFILKFGFKRTKKEAPTFFKKTGFFC